MKDVLILALDFILICCGYSCQIKDFPIRSIPIVEAQVRIECFLNEKSLLKPNEILGNFFKREDVQQAFQETSFMLELSRDDKDLLVKIMT